MRFLIPLILTMELFRVGYIQSTYYTAPRYATHDYAVNRNKTNQPKTPEEKATIESNSLGERLNLNQNQISKIYDLVLNRINIYKEINEKYANDKSAYSSNIEKLNENFANQIKSVLTAEQYKKWQELQEERKAKCQH